MGLAVEPSSPHAGHPDPGEPVALVRSVGCPVGGGVGDPWAHNYKERRIAITRTRCSGIDMVFAAMPFPPPSSRRIEQEKINARVHMVPVLQAEEDRKYE